MIPCLKKLSFQDIEQINKMVEDIPWTLEPPTDPAEISALEAEFNAEVEAMKSKVLSCQKFILEPSAKFIKNKRPPYSRGAASHNLKSESDTPKAESSPTKSSKPVSDVKEGEVTAAVSPISESAVNNCWTACSF